MKALAGYWAGGMGSLLLKLLVDELSTRGLHDPLFVRFRGIAMPCAIREPLHHIAQPL